MNGFQKHGLTHISASQINAFRTSPAAWIARYIEKRTFPANWNMIRGLAAEKGVDCVARKAMSISSGIGEAMSELERLSVGWPDQDKGLTDNTPLIEKWVELCSMHLREEFTEYNNIDSQVKISIPCALGNGASIEIVGYMDWIATNTATGEVKIYDMKTTSRAPSKMSLSHRIQGAIYMASQDVDSPECEFVYCLTRKANPILALPLSMEDALAAINIALQTVRAMNSLLMVGGTKTDPIPLASCFVDDPESFYFK